MKIISDLSVTSAPLSARQSWGPDRLFRDGANGALYQPTQASVLYADTAGTVPASTPGDLIARINDVSGNNRPLIQPTSGLRPMRHESGQNVLAAQFDMVDDVMTTGPIAGGLSGQCFVAGDGGCFVTPLSVSDGGSFEIGGNQKSYTGAVPGALNAVTGPSGRVLGAIIREGTFSASEIARLQRFFIARGGKGLLVPGSDLITNGAFDNGLAGWGLNAAAAGTVSATSGVAEFSAPHGDFASLTATGVAVAVGQPYLVSVNLLGRPSASAMAYCYFGGQTVFGLNCSGLSDQTVTRVIVPLNTGTISMQVRTDGAIGFDNISVRQMIP